MLCVIFKTKILLTQIFSLSDYQFNLIYEYTTNLDEETEAKGKGEEFGHYTISLPDSQALIS